MTLPNFLIIGAHKAGTTSLYRYLQQHPDVFLPAIKEARYFSYNPDEPAVSNSPYGYGASRHPVKSREQYEDLFSGVTAERAIGEASPCYLNNPYAPARVKQLLSGPRLIVSLRDPVDRAYSGYQMAVRDGAETRPFMEILRESPDWHPVLTYLEPCRRWLECFPRQSFRFIRAESLRTESTATMSSLFSFLEVDPAFAVDTSRQFNSGGMPRSARLHRVLGSRHIQTLRPHVPAALRSVLRPLKRANLKPATALSTAERAELIDLFREPVLRLQELLDMTFPTWLEPDRTSSDTVSAQALQ